MESFLLASVLGHLLYGGAVVWLFLFFYVEGVCQLDRPRLKRTTALLNIGFLLAGLAFPFLFPHVETLREALTLSPVTPAGWAFLILLGGIWCGALAGQTWVTLRLLRPEKIPELVAEKVSRVPYTPDREHWDLSFADVFGCDQIPPNPAAGQPFRYKKRHKTHLPRSWASRLLLEALAMRANQVYELRIVELTLRLPRLPRAFDGFRILHLSDLHLGRDLSPGYYRHALTCAAQLRPDLVVFTGDFTGMDAFHREAVASLSLVKGRLGTWVVFGNHDYYDRPEMLDYWLRHDRIGRLNNGAVEFRRPAPPEVEADYQALRLIGTEHPHQPVSDWEALVSGTDCAVVEENETDEELEQTEASDGRPDTQRISLKKTREKSVPEDPVFKIALTHRPDYFVPLARAGADLVLAGHTHGGQWRFPFIGPVVVPSLYGRRYAYGLHRRGQALLSISPGFGVHTIPLRYNCPPEITLLELR
ncbi:MAG TPA: metallophosphoesterase, partial [Candidatus Sumerlaeota bacterium]|nr:metallophosphoesterase [Candidatus Sumerlaeota bacterium]